MRGAQIGFAASNNTRRIIPADAGSTFTGTWGFKDYEDHPRGCGEHSVAMRTNPLLRGSSPRMRGAR